MRMIPFNYVEWNSSGAEMLYIYTYIYIYVCVYGLALHWHRVFISELFQIKLWKIKRSGVGIIILHASVTLCSSSFDHEFISFNAI